MKSPFLLTVGISALFLVSGKSETDSPQPSRPNILLIMADDLGFSDLGCYGGEIQTPNLDSIAAEGLRFTQFYNTGRCWPTRGSLLTGFYAQQIRRDKLPGVPSGGGNAGKRQAWAELLPKRLKEVGYRSYHTGKWHIDGMPIAEGFDHSYYLKDQSRFFSPKQHWKDDKPLPAVQRGTGFYGTTALADHAVEVLQDHAENHKEKPFFHYLAFAAPHFPLHALPEDIAIYDEAYDAGWDVIRQERWKRIQEMGMFPNGTVPQLSRVEKDLGPPYHFPDAFSILGEGEINKPLSWKQLSEEQKKFQAKKMAIHAAMIDRMDREIGRVFAQIKKMGEWEDTMVLFLSDNGASAEIMVRGDGHDPKAEMGSADTYLCLGPGWSTASNTPFRRHKTWTHEGGIATPFLVSWPKGIKARGEFRHDPGHVIDVVPTLLELSGAEWHSNAPQSPGRSLAQAFSKDRGNPHQAIWWFHDGHKAIRMGDWKAVAPIQEPWELYDLSKDRGESVDLAVTERAKLDELTGEWQRLMEEFREIASEGVPKKLLGKAEQRAGSTMGKAQEMARPKSKQVLLGGERFLHEDRHAFLMKPKEPAKTDSGKPWIFYGPTLPRYPDKAESWMHQQFLDAGVAVAGIDVGEMYGSPLALPFFDALYEEMVKRGYSKTPALLGRSRGGLWVSSWAIANPKRVAGIGGIYPVYDYTTYPGVERAAGSYGITAEELLQRQDELNPIRNADVLAKAKIPVFIIHGTEDKVVPLPENSGSLKKAYEKAGVADLFELIEAEGQGHSFWEGFFTCQGLVDFLIARAKGN